MRPAHPPGGDDAARPTVLTRLASALLAYNAARSEVLWWECCWIAYPYPRPGWPAGQAVWRICADTCTHAHHEAEVFLA